MRYVVNESALFADRNRPALNEKPVYFDSGQLFEAFLHATQRMAITSPGLHNAPIDTVEHDYSNEDLPLSVFAHDEITGIEWYLEIKRVDDEPYRGKHVKE